jgi:hypothetical protein
MDAFIQMIKTSIEDALAETWGFDGSEPLTLPRLAAMGERSWRDNLEGPRLVPVIPTVEQVILSEAA